MKSMATNQLHIFFPLSLQTNWANNMIINIFECIFCISLGLCFKAIISTISNLIGLKNSNTDTQILWDV